MAERSGENGELLEFREPPRWRSLIGNRPDFNAERYESAEPM